MADKLKLVVHGGALIGSVLDIPEGEATLGGKGSGARFEVSGVSLGIKFVEFRLEGKGWVLEEIAQGKVLLNGGKPRRRNRLRTGDIVTLPSVRDNEPIDFEVQIERDRRRNAFAVKIDFSRVNPVYLAVGVVYLLMFVIAGAYFADRRMNTAAVERRPIATVLRDDIQRAAPAEPAQVLYDSVPRSFDDVRIVLATNLPQDQKDALIEAFVQDMDLRFAAARRAADLGLNREAREHYVAIIGLMGDGQLSTTHTALRELAAVPETGRR